MTTAARLVLADCQLAVEMLDAEENADKWRVLWAGAVALIRAVGHVLDKVDGKNPAVKRKSKAAYLSWMSGDIQHEIFRDFIEDERNSVLKEYASRVHPLADVPVAIVLRLLDPHTGKEREVAIGEGLPDNLFKPVVDGFGAGEDARDVYRAAIDWWKIELEAIDAAS